MASSIKERANVLLWEGLVSLLLLWWGLAALQAPYGSLAVSSYWGAAAAVAAWGLCALAAGRKRAWLRWGLGLLLWAALLPWLGEALRGLSLWADCILTLWNQLHRDGLPLFQPEATSFSVMMATVLAGVVLGQLLWHLIHGRKLLPCGLLGLGLLLLQLLTNSFLPLPAALWLTGYVGLWMSGQRVCPPRQTVRLWLLCGGLLCLCAVLQPSAELAEVTAFREEVAREVHLYRYGQDTLPQGDLSKAAQLDQGDTELLTVHTGQEKQLYLRAYTGADYENGSWLPLSGEAYTEPYRGMLSWLADQGFDPLTQPAAYYALCGQDAPEKNTLDVHVTDGARCYLYLPATTAAVEVGYRDQRDQRMMPKGFMGASWYTAEELSPARPAELTVRAAWITDPQTEAQQRYLEAETVYRAFVYDSYTQPDAALEPLLQELFWQEEPESDSIYSAVDRVRSVLKSQVSYEAESAPEGTEPIRDFLTGSRRGNAALYASAAVEALRCRGIPARYVEGYYVSQQATAENGGAVSLTGRDAHAWVEVYFDGIGWLPVDVTPGYYLDALTLQQMVALPDTVRKTAALDDGDTGGEDLPITSGGGTAAKPLAAVWDAALLLLGLLALVILALSAWYLGRQLRNWIANGLRRRQYRAADAREKARLLERWIYRGLAAQGIDACLGWNVPGTDKETAARIPEVGTGDYARAAVLMERATYGGQELEPYELRTLETFLVRIWRRESSFRDWLKEKLHPAG